MNIYHTTSLSSSMAILRAGFSDYQHYLEGKRGVWVTDLPSQTGSTLICKGFPENIFIKFEHEWAHAWRKAFIPSSILNEFDWSLFEIDLPQPFDLTLPPDPDL